MLDEVVPHGGGGLAPLVLAGGHEGLQGKTQLGGEVLDLVLDVRRTSVALGDTRLVGEDHQLVTLPMQLSQPLGHTRVPPPPIAPAGGEGSSRLGRNQGVVL